MIANISSQYENVKTISDKEVFITAKSEKNKKTEYRIDTSKITKWLRFVTKK